MVYLTTISTYGECKASSGRRNEFDRVRNDEELHNLYSSPSIIRMIKSRRMRWAGHVTRMGRRGTYMGFFFGGVGLTSPGTAATSGLLYSPI
jgi:hypothetical protein